MANDSFFQNILARAKKILTDFFGQEEQIRQEAEQVVAETLKKEDQEKINKIKETINQL